MGVQMNYLEIARRLSDPEIAEVAAKINDIIVLNKHIVVHTPYSHGNDIDTSHIPEDYDLSQGIVRVVLIGHIDANPCCGTHLTSTGQIQAVSLLHQVNIRSSNSCLHFVCGLRVPEHLQMFHRLLNDVLGMQLSCQIEEVGLKLLEVLSSLRKAQTCKVLLLKELAVIKAAEIFRQFTEEKNVAVVYREGSGKEYLAQAQKELTTLMKSRPELGVSFDKFTLALFDGDYKSAGGMVKVIGPMAELLQKYLKKIVANLMGGRRGNTFQGKVTKYERGEVENVLQYFE